MGEPEIDRSTAFMSNSIFFRQYLIEMLALNSMNTGADAIKKFNPSLVIPYLGV
jgi:hypothetical protein